MVKLRPGFVPTKDTPYLALMDEFWDVFRKFLSDKVTAVYRNHTRKYDDNDLLMQIRPITWMKSD